MVFNEDRMSKNIYPRNLFVEAHPNLADKSEINVNCVRFSVSVAFL